MMIVDNKFDFGDEVYLKTDKEQDVRIVTGMCINPGSIVYYLSCGTNESKHYEFEISAEKNVLMSTTN